MQKLSNFEQPWSIPVVQAKKFMFDGKFGPPVSVLKSSPKGFPPPAPSTRELTETARETLKKAVKDQSLLENEDRIDFYRGILGDGLGSDGIDVTGGHQRGQIGQAAKMIST
jgi:hypothetical protein